MAGSVSGARRLGAFGRAVLYLFLAVVGLTMLAPFFWTTTTSLRTQEDIFSDVLTVPLPSPRVLSMWIPWERRVVVDGLEVPAVALETLERVELPNGETLDLAPGRVKKTLFSQECVVLPKDEAGQPLKARFVGRFVAVRTLGEGSRRLVVPAEEVMWRPKPVWENYVTAWHRVPFGRGYFNSVLVAAVITLGQVLTSSLAAYAFARLTFPGRDKLFLGYLATLMIPAVVTMIPVFILMRTLPDALNNLTNTDVWTGQLAVSLGGRHFNLGRPVGTDSYFALIAPALWDLPPAPVLHGNPARPGRRGLDRRMQPLRHVQPDSDAAFQAGAGDADDLHLHGDVEVLHVAADCHKRAGDAGPSRVAQDLPGLSHQPTRDEPAHGRFHNRAGPHAAHLHAGAALFR